MSEDTKWWIRTLFIFLTFAVLLYTLYYRFGNRGLDTATGSRRNWVAKRLLIYLKNYDTNEYLFTDPDLHDLTDNAENYRLAREYIARGYGTYRCPWGDTCPALVNKLVDDEGNSIDKDNPITAEEHARYAYNARLKQIETRARNRKLEKSKFDIIVDDDAKNSTVSSYVKRLTSSDLIAAGYGSYRIVGGSIKSFSPAQTHTTGTIVVRSEAEKAQDTADTVVFRIDGNTVRFTRTSVKDSNARFTQIESLERVTASKIGFYDKSPTSLSRLLVF